MNRFAIPALAFAAGIAAATFGHFNTSPALAATQMNTMRMGTNMPDSQMQGAMSKMNATMKSMHMSGDVDRDFMMMMIAHHQSAIDMAQVQLKFGRKPALKAMAQDVIASQSKEITQMHKWLHQWYGL